MESEPVPQVYACIVGVSADLAQQGISKERKNESQGFRFRGIDDVFNALAPLLVKHKLVIQPFYSDHSVTPLLTAKGSTLYNTRVTGTFTFVSAVDGSSTSVVTYGEAMDSGDKSTNKAMSAAYKYAAFQTFCIPTEGDNDADATTHEATAVKPPDGFDEWFIDLIATSDDGVYALKKLWTESSEAFRNHAQQFHGETWTKAKKKSAAVDKKRAAEMSA